MVPDVAEHARFFDHLVELVPAKYYYDDEFARVNPRHLAKAAREARKADVKLKARVAKREKLDPDKAATTLGLQRRKAQASKDHTHANGVNDDGPSGSARLIVGPAAAQRSGDQPSGTATVAGLNLQLSGATMSRQELLERLHKKVEEARQRRKASEATAAKAKEWKQNALRDNAAAKQQQAKQQQQQQQRQQQQLAGSKRKGGAEEPAGGPGGKPQGPQGQGGKGHQSAKKARRQEDEAVGASSGGGGGEEQPDFKFPRIELEDGGRHGKHHAGRKLSKQALLKQAEARKSELEALGDTDEGKAKAQQVAWKAALARAAGEKVLDDPKLLRRSLKREGKRREKHSKAWQERAAAQQDAQAARQAKRKENLAVRRQTKLDNKKAKREKKLLRPGFEGRKEGFITPGGGGGGGGGGRVGGSSGK